MLKNIDKKDLIKRIILLVAGLAILALGISFSIKSNLGISPVTSVPYVMSLFINLSVGNLTIIIYSFLILLQILILRKRFKLFQLLQLPVAIAFGYLADFAIWATQGISASTYGQQWALTIAGILLASVGVYLQLKANLVTLAVEGLVASICKVLPVKFGSIKTALDVSFVMISVILSLVFMGGLYGVREGTVATAIFVGLTVKEIHRLEEMVKEKFPEFSFKALPEHD